MIVIVIAIVIVIVVLLSAVVVLSEHGNAKRNTTPFLVFCASHRGHLLRAEINRHELVELGAERLHLVRLEHALCVH
jgi:hypothetical protein